jgi:hypothetical protein
VPQNKNDHEDGYTARGADCKGMRISKEWNLARCHQRKPATKSQKFLADVNATLEQRKYPLTDQTGTLEGAALVTEIADRLPWPCRAQPLNV